MKVLATLFCLTIGLPALAQYWGRATQSLYTNEAMDVEIDLTGNHYVAGYIMGTTGFDNPHLLTASGSGDIYVAKYDSDGELIWLRKFGGNLPDRAYDLAIGPDQHPVITGQFSGQVAFDATTLSSIGDSKDVFVLKLNPAGNVVWARQEGGGMTDCAFGVTVDQQNNVIVTGQFQGSATIAGSPFASLPDPATLSPGYDLFIAKYTASGTALWARTGQADYEEKGLAVHTDAQNNIFLTGQFSDTIVLAGQTFNNAQFNVGLFARFDPTGTLQWMYPLKAGSVTPHDLEVNSSNEVIVTGDFTGNMTYTDASGNHAVTNPYTEQIFVLKTANNGSYTWHQTYGSGSDVSARSVSVDVQNGIYVTGWFKCEFEELQNGNEAIFNSVGFKDPYLIKISNSGQTAYAKHTGGKLDDEGHGVALAQPDMPVLCGSFSLDLNLRANDLIPYALGPDNFHFYVETSEATHVYLIGDSTRNSFLMRAIHPLTPELDFFGQSDPDSLDGYIVGITAVFSPPDTLHFCQGGHLIYNPNTPPHLGPSYNYLWENGTTNQINYLSGDGTYFVHVERNDGCVAGDDTVQVVIHSPPNLPLMTDNIGMADSTLEYVDYTFCEDDSVQVWFTNYDPDATTTIIGTQPELVNDSLPHYYGGGPYTILATDAYCTAGDDFSVLIIPEPEYDSIVPYLSIGGSDTATICRGEGVWVWVLDSLTNPTGILQTPDELYVSYSWLVNPPVDSGENPYYDEVFPITTGWYTFDYSILLGYVNMCNVDTARFHVLDSFYFIVHPVPEIVIPILGEPLLCPNGSSTIYVATPHPDFSWSGPGIAWTSSDHDSITVVSPGDYYYSGMLTDPQNGCSAYFSFPFVLLPKDPPAVLPTGGEAIICPGDSVLMAVPEGYASYVWTGPQNDTLSTVYEVYGSVPGSYNCTVIDVDGCELNAVPFNLFSWTPPYLVTEPTDILCAGETIDLTAVYTGTAGVQWLSPISSTAATITVEQPGIYICEVQQCGITITDSVVIVDGSFVLTLTVSDTALCYGESAVLTAGSGYSLYQWSDGTSGTHQLVTQEAGSYWLTATNNYGCEANSDTVNVGLSEGSELPAVTGTTICPGEDVTLTDQSAFTANWFSADSVLVATGPSFTLNNLLTDTSVLVAYSVSECPFAFQSVTINVTDSLPPFAILGDSLLCPGEMAVFTHSLSGYSQTWLHDGTILGSAGSVTVSQVIFIDDPFISLAVSNSCFSDTVHEAIVQAVPQTVSLPADSLLVCVYSENGLVLNESVEETYWQGNFGTFTGNELTIGTLYDNGWIYASATDLNGCLTNTDSVYIEIIDCDGPLPNVITPNGDGINDFFFLDDALANPGNRLIVLNRWGNVVFEANGYANEFDGRNISDGVYFYIFYPDPVHRPEIKKHGFLHIGH